ncbi:ATP-binding protein [Methylorubrum extorquens]|jgi:PAS domain S-box-containing protein|nr:MULTISPECIES: ATP-binding protein [Methylorubrum]ARO53415.1 hybrid sensor histidine kinase/response regulator [Methylorubrum zatmanii]KQP86047.1 histidine kinase [Methylobacterium sp. Leaf119]KQP99437.1 histidine kinase [Methylobacterium sp. Leaf121]WIU39389.1 response regulator [Methylorubrum extorquens]
MTLAVSVMGLSIAAAMLALILVSLRRREPVVPESDMTEALQDRLWQIAESEERYRVLVEATTEAVVQRDGQGRITFASAGFAALLGMKPLELIGSTLSPQVIERGASEQRADGVRVVEERLVPVDGLPRWFSFIEMPVSGSVDGPNWLRAGQDVTARVEAARVLDEAKSRAEAANVAKSRFLATVSHELRTPLNGILGMADLLLDTRLDPEQRTYVEAFRTSGKALLGLVDGILDFSRIEAGRLDLAAEPFDVAALVEGVVELLAPRAQDKGLEIALDIADDLAALRVGDADRVRQILVNLAGNAIKFTQAGGVGVSLARSGEGQGEGLVLTVEDTGPGIPEERIPILFEEFEQGDDSASHEGTGLGLAITRRLVERMNGTIEARSTVGRGSTFRVVLPLPAAEGAMSPETPSLAPRKVLIVAASPYQAPFLARRLSRSGAAAVVVNSAEAALDALSGVAFDALIADRSLGDAAVRRLAAEAARCGVRCSLILLSPFDRREFGAPNAAGFDSYLIKPVRARSLFDRLLEPRPAPARSPADATAKTGTSQPGPRQPAPVKTTPGKTGSIQTAARGRRVLLAEDNPINALLATKALERLGAQVIHARDGLEALAAAEGQGPFDLALIDIRMPGLDGLETARRIRAREAETGASPLHLVALTANTGREDVDAASAAGFDGFLPKPLNLRALPALLDRRQEEAA